MSTQEQWIWFDLGGVLVDIQMNAALSHWEEIYGLPSEVWTNALFASGLKENMDKGKISTEQVVETLREICPAMDRTGFDAGWRKVLTPRPSWLPRPRIGGTLPARSLVQYGSVHFQWAQEEISGLSSMRMHLVRFRQMLETRTLILSVGSPACVLPPENVFFVDDLVKNVEGARTSGIDAVSLQAKEFRQTLMHRGFCGDWERRAMKMHPEPGWPFWFWSSSRF